MAYAIAIKGEWRCIMVLDDYEKARQIAEGKPNCEVRETLDFPPKKKRSSTKPKKGNKQHE